MGPAPTSQAKYEQRFGDTESTSDKSAGASPAKTETLFWLQSPTRRSARAGALPHQTEAIVVISVSGRLWGFNPGYLSQARCSPRSGRTIGTGATANGEPPTYSWYADAFGKGL